MNNEEHSREPDEQGPQEAGSEPVEEAQGTPADPGAVEDAEIVEESEDPTGIEDLTEEPPGVAEEEVAAVLVELDRARKERDEYLEALKRLKAEFENSRKRQERELTQIRERASERLVAELLPVLDNLDRALESDGDIRGGVQATREQLAAVLGDEGLAIVASDGQHPRRRRAKIAASICVEPVAW